MAEAVHKTQRNSNSDLLLQEVESMLTDTRFLLPSQQAAVARETASHFLKMGKVSGVKEVEIFADELVQKLRNCLPILSNQSQREQMWREFHKIRTSENFLIMWSTVIHKATDIPPHPAFYQHVTDLVFRRLIKLHLPCQQTESTSPTTTNVPLTYEEGNALRYVAGYICRSVRNKLDSAAHPLKEELVLCLMELCKDHGVSVSEEDSAEWMNLVDRGGLWHVSDDLYKLFVAIELDVRRYLCRDKAPELSDGFKEYLVDKVINSSDVQFQWCIIATEYDEDEEQSLLKMIVHQFITVRGFSFASSWMEQYKQGKKKTIQRSKGLRRELYTDKMC